MPSWLLFIIGTFLRHLKGGYMKRLVMSSSSVHTSGGGLRIRPQRPLAGSVKLHHSRRLDICSQALP